MDKAQFKDWLKEYGKKIAAKLPEGEQDRFKKGFQTFAKKVLVKYDDFSIYVPSNYNYEDTLIFSFWKNESDEAPCFWFLLDGLKSYKV